MTRNMARPSLFRPSRWPAYGAIPSLTVSHREAIEVAFGKPTVEPTDPETPAEPISPCPACSGYGRIRDHPGYLRECPTCEGWGTTQTVAAVDMVTLNPAAVATDIACLQRRVANLKDRLIARCDSLEKRISPALEGPEGLRAFAGRLVDLCDAIQTETTT